MVTVGDADGNCCDAAIGDVVATDEVCPGAEDGTITITATCSSCTSIEYSIGSAFQASNVFANVTPGTYTVTIQDSGDASCTATQAVTVTGGVDTEAPTITCPTPAILACTDLVGSDESLAPSGGSTGGYISISLNVSNSSTSAWELGQTMTVTQLSTGNIREYVVSNINGNDRSLSLNEPREGFSIAGNFIVDNPALGLAMEYGHNSTFPSFSTISLRSASASINYATLLGLPTATDNCTMDGGITVTNNIPADFPINQTVLVTYTATDLAGLSGTCTQEVTLRDDEAPASPILADNRHRSNYHGQLCGYHHRYHHGSNHLHCCW